MSHGQRGVPERLGPYEVGAKISGGGMATIYVGRRAHRREAPDQAHRREAPDQVSADGRDVVAIKLIRDDLASDSRYIDMFLDEARILSRLSHPNIIVTHDYGVEEDARFIAMELLLGRSLMDAFDRAREQETRVPLDLAAHVAKQVAEALAYAHDLTSEAGTPLKIVHRDVNPTNVFLTYDGDVKLIDFGLAKTAAARLSKSGEGVVKGKVPYLSPEQLEERPFDGRADLYSLGTTLWEMTTGRRLFKRENDVETIRAIRARDVPDPRELVDGDYPDALWKIVRRALEPEPEDRYENARAMAHELDEFLQKHGRAGDLRVALSEWIEKLFPGERAKQEAWLDEVSVVNPAPPMTMRPPAPLAGSPVDSKPSNPPAPLSIEAPRAERHALPAWVALAVAVCCLALLAVVIHRC